MNMNWPDQKNKEQVLGKYMNQLHFTPDVGRRGKLHHKVNHITHYSLLADPFQLPSRRLRDIWRIVAPALMPFWLVPHCFCLDSQASTDPALRFWLTWNFTCLVKESFWYSVVEWIIAWMMFHLKLIGNQPKSANEMTEVGTVCIWETWVT